MPHSVSQSVSQSVSFGVSLMRREPLILSALRCVVARVAARVAAYAAARVGLRRSAAAVSSGGQQRRRHPCPCQLRRSAAAAAPMPVSVAAVGRIQSGGGAVAARCCELAWGRGLFAERARKVGARGGRRAREPERGKSEEEERRDGAQRRRSGEAAKPKRSEERREHRAENDDRARDERRRRARKQATNATGDRANEAMCPRPHANSQQCAACAPPPLWMRPTAATDTGMGAAAAADRRN